jgi:hypothetical protein
LTVAESLFTPSNLFLSFQEGCVLGDDLSRPQIDRQTGWDFYGLIASLSIHYSTGPDLVASLEIIDSEDFYFTPYIAQ